MNIENQFLFLLSAVGGLTGIFLSCYFIFIIKNRRLSDYFLGGLIASLSIRTLKSAFLYFNRSLFLEFIQLGLIACALIGPFLFLYIRITTKEKSGIKWWWVHVIPYIIVFFLFANQFSYYDENIKWNYFVEAIYKQWAIYIVLSAYLLKHVFVKIVNREKLNDKEFWQLNILLGTFFVWLAYETSHYTSYIVGALSFTFIVYTSILYLLYIKLDKKIATDPPLKYANSSLSNESLLIIKYRLDKLMETDKPFTNPNLNLLALSKQLGVTSKELSQVINQTENHNFSKYIALKRIEKAKELLSSKEYVGYKISAIAYESGFSSISSFNTYFKNIVGMTASDFREK